MGSKILLFLGLFLTVVPPSLVAAPGDLDTGFGTNGIVDININNQQSFAGGFVIQDDGKFVIGGTTGAVGSRDFMMIRGLPDAMPDTDFGNNGVVFTTVGPGEDIERDVAVLPDGKILAVGMTDANGSFDVVLVRYETDGSLDATFGSAGVAIVPIPSVFVFPTRMAVQPDGRILVVGGSGSSGGFASVFVARYLADGTPDTSFDGDGVAEIQPGGDPGLAAAVSLQDDGKIVVAGSSGPSGGQQLTVLRLKPDGSLDSSFDGDGVVVTAFGPDTGYAQGLVIQPDGRILVAGARESAAASQVALARYLSDGTPDASFGTDGVVQTPIGTDGGAAAALVLQDDGKILVAGSAAKGVLDSDSLLLRYLPDGTLDPDFAGGGIVTTDAGDSDRASAIALQSDGKIVIEGQNDLDLFMIRYEGDPPAPPGPEPSPSSGGCGLVR